MLWNRMVVNGCTAINMLNIVESYTNIWTILFYVVYISVKLFKMYKKTVNGSLVYPLKLFLIWILFSFQNTEV